VCVSGLIDQVGSSCVLFMVLFMPKGLE
jgi:hypothetical protein